MSSCQYGFNILGQEICFDFLVQGVVNDVVDPIENFFTNLFQQVITDLQNIGASVSSAIQQTLSQISTVVAQAMQNAASTILNAFSAAGNDLKQFFSSIGNDIISTLQNVYTFIQTSIYGAITSLHDDITNYFSNVLNGLDVLGSDLKNFFSSAIENVGNTLSGALNVVRDDVTNYFTNVFQNLQTLGNDLKNFFSNAAQTIVSTLEQDIHAVESTFSTVFQSLEQGFSTIITDIEKALQQFFSILQSLGNDVINGLKTFGVDAYEGLKTVTQDILSGLDAVVKALENAFKDIPLNLLQQIQGFSRANIENQFEKLIAFMSIPAGTYIASTAGIKVLENIHPFHELHIQEFSDKIMEMFGVYEIPQKITEGLIEFGVFKPLEYSLNFLLRPRISDLGIESRALIYGYESEEELRQALAIEGYTDDLIDKYVKTIYRPMPPFILRYLIETGLASKDFITRQLQMEGFPPDEIPTITKIFDALDLVPFQNQAKSVIYTYYKAGLLNDQEAVAIMNAFQIPQVQQQWILAIAKKDFDLEQKTLLVNLTLDLLSRAEITVDQCISTLTGLGVNQNRAKVQCNIRAVTSAPPPPKSTRAQLLQEAIKNLGGLGLS